MDLIPDQAKCTYEGVDYNIYQMETELSDGNRETIEIVRGRDAAKTILIKNDHIIIAQESIQGKGNYYALLGGRLKWDENPGEGAGRKLTEESGYMAHDLQHIFEFTRQAPIRFKVHVFVSHDFSLITEPILSAGHKIKLKEVSFDEFIEIVLGPNFRGEQFKEKVKEIVKDQNTLKDFRTKILGLLV